MNSKKLVYIIGILLLFVGIVQTSLCAKNAFAMEVDKSKWPKGVSIAAARMGGVFYSWAAGWQKVLTEKVGINANVETTGGAVQNIILVNKGDSNFGITTSTHAFLGWKGLGFAKGEKLQNIRLILPMYSTYVQGIALKKMGIKKVRDLEGKVVGPGPKGSGSNAIARNILEFLEIKPKRIVNSSWQDLTRQMKDGLLDAQFTVGGLPMAAFAELEATDEFDFFGIEKADADRIIAKFPYYIEGTVPAGAYKAVTKPVNTVSAWILLIAKKDLPEDFIYEIVKKTYANQNIIASVHPAGKDMPMERAAFSPIPLHTGTLRYFIEKGVKLPENVYPPEFKK